MKIDSAVSSIGLSKGNPYHFKNIDLIVKLIYKLLLIKEKLSYQSVRLKLKYTVCFPRLFKKSFPNLRKEILLTLDVLSLDIAL